MSIPQGAIRLNTDSQKLEFFAQDRWFEMATDTPIMSGGTRGLSMGGQSGSTDFNYIDFVTIPTGGNAQDFGNIDSARTQQCGFSSKTRAFIAGGMTSPGTYKNIIAFGQFNTTGLDFSDFGDLTKTVRLLTGFSNSTRGITAGGANPSTDIMDFITMSSQGDAKDFGDLYQSDFFNCSLASPTRGVILDGSNNDNTISFVSIATKGNAQDFGDKTLPRGDFPQAASNSIRGIIGGGSYPGTPSTDDIQFLTIATKGNTMKFGDLTRSTAEGDCAVTDPTRCVFMGNGPSVAAVIDYVNIATQGDAVDFGDLANGSRTHNSGASNGHGGL